MKTTARALMLLLAAISSGAQTSVERSATAIPSGDIEAFIKALPAAKVSDLPIRVVDVGGYRQRRVAALQKFTQQIANEVLESGGERALEPMSPADRKVVHDTVNEIEGLVTRSEGEDSARHVVIAPAS